VIPRERVAAAVTALGRRSAEPDVRAQLAALSALVRNLGDGPPPARAELEAALDAALAAGDEAAVVAAARALARAERAAVVPVDWSAASHG